MIAKPQIFGRSAWVGFGITAILYVVSYLMFLGWTDFAPYVMDNNESFSNLVHTENAIRFGLNGSKGLADESPSMLIDNPHAHPLLHTHQGNFPRLFTGLLYLFGAHSIESQTTITTSTVGLLTVLLGYCLIQCLSNSFVATLFCLFLMTDYILFAQWNTNLYRVWHGFFFFGVFYNILSLRDLNFRTFKIISLGLLYAGIFYWDFTFASFLWAAGLAYMFWNYWKSHRRLLWTVFVVQSGAAFFSLAVLFCQLVAHMGLRNTLLDVYYTLKARNILTDAAFKEQVFSFYENLNVIFWPSFASDTSVRSITWFVRSFFSYHLQPWTPYLAMVLLFLSVAVAAQWLGCLLKRKDEELQKESGDEKRVREVEMTSSQCSVSRYSKGLVFVAGIALVSCFCFFLNNVWADFVALPEANRSIVFSATTPGFVIILLVSILSTATIGVWILLFDRKRGILWRTSLCCVVLIGFAWFARHQGNQYEVHLRDLWRFIYANPFGHLMDWVLWPSIGIVVCFHLFLAGSKQFLPIGKAVNRTIPLIVAVLIGFLVAWSWGAGYLSYFYLKRYNPFASFVLYLLPAFAIWLLVYTIRETTRIAMRSGYGGLVGKVVFVSVPISILLFISTAWVQTQAAYVQLLPATFGKFFATFRRPELQQSSFALANYPLPIAQASQGWAINLIGQYDQQPRFAGEQPTPISQDGMMIWFADRLTNKAYVQPRYFVHFGLQNQLYHAAERATILLNGGERENIPDYVKDPIVQEALGLAGTPFRHRLVARDEGPWGLWAIVELDQQSIPYLKSIEMHDAKDAPRVAILHFVPANEKRDKTTPVWEMGLIGADAVSDELLSQFTNEFVWVVPASSETITLQFREDAPNGTLVAWNGPVYRTFNTPVGRSKAKHRTVSVPIIDAAKPVANVTGILPRELPSASSVLVCPNIDRIDDGTLRCYPKYMFADSNDEAESGTRWRLWKETNENLFVPYAETDKRIAFEIPADEKRSRWIVSVIPATTKRAGFEAFSQPFTVSK